MDLQDIRKYLDQLDTALRYILLQRMALIPLVAETKLEKNIPMYQPGREEQIYNSLRDFSLAVGLNPQLLTDIYKTIIKEAHNIENKIIDGIVSSTSSDQHQNLLDQLEKIDTLIKEYISLIEETRIKSSELDKPGENFIKIFTDYYKEKISSES
ncbi:MAG: chorismate mutase [Ignavibacteriales bacterium]